jgi:tRNA(Ile)-lysidine synthase
MSIVVSVLKEFDFTNKKLLVACSGGADSIALLNALIELKYKPNVLHVNYGLRESESEGDEQFVSEFCENHNLRCIVEKCPIELLKGEGKNLQNEARKFRRKLFQEWIRKSENHIVLLGHHADDQVETFFLNYFRGSGLWGLAGMDFENNQIVRPFLNLSKSDLLDYLILRDQSFRQDSSNLKSDYLRNLFRNELIPNLESSIPELKKSVLFLQDKFRKEKQNQLKIITDFIEDKKCNAQISWEEWDELSSDLKFAFAKKMNWKLSVFNRIDELRSLNQGKCIDESDFFRTKQGFAWTKTAPYKNDWEFKFELIEKLEFDLDKYHLRISKVDFELLSFTTPKKGMFLQKNGFKTEIFKLLKDSGVPLYWRDQYPIICLNDEVIWIPGIGVSSSFSRKVAEKRYILSWKNKNL